MTKPKIDTPALLLIAGQPGAGKTHMIQWMISSMCASDKFSYGVVFRGPQEGSYGFLPAKYVHRAYNESTILKIIRLQSIQTTPKPMFLVMDLVSFDINMNSDLFKRLIMTHKSLNITIFLTTVNVTQTTPLLRQLSTHLILFNKHTSKESAKILADDYLYDIDRKDVAGFIRAKITRQYDYFIVRKALHDNNRYASERAPANPSNRNIIY